MTPPPRAALAGVRVADFSRVLAGPYATMMLGDLGADVIKIESPAGDDTRQWKPPIDASGQSTYFASVNRNKRAVTLDLTTPDDLATARELALGSDILVENFKPGGMAGFGLDYETLSAFNPRLIYCSISGFGDEGGAALPGYDLLVQAVGGLMSITGDPDGRPTKAGVALVDVLTGMNAVIGIQSALRVRDQTGLGQQVQVNLLQSLLSALVNQASGALATGVAPRAMGNAHPSIAPYESYDAADRPVVVAVGNNRQFAGLARVIGAPELADDPRFASNADRVAHRDELRTAIERRLRNATAASWTAHLTAAGVPSGRVNDVVEAIEFATQLGLDPVVELPVDAAGEAGGQGGRGDAGMRLIANPIRLTETPPSYRLAPPDVATNNTIEWMPKEQ